MVYSLVVVAEAFLAQLAKVLRTNDVLGAVVVAKVEWTVVAETGVRTDAAETKTAAAAAVVAAVEQICSNVVAGESKTVAVVAPALLDACLGEVAAGRGATL